MNSPTPPRQIQLRIRISVDSHPRRRLAARLVAWASRPAARHAVAVAPQRPAGRKESQEIEIMLCFFLETVSQRPSQ
jgi:hypothetical protein